MSECQLRAYLATALTNLSAGERAEVFSCSDLVDRVCCQSGLSLYKPKDYTDPLAHAEKKARDVYLTDRERVATSDIIIALCTHPSHGVGAENEIASNAGVPVLHIVKDGFKLSKMLAGSIGETHLVVYTGLADLEQKLSQELMQIIPKLAARRQRYETHDGTALRKRLKDLRERSNLSVERLAELVGMSEAELDVLESQDEQVSLPTLAKIRRFAEALCIPVGYLVGETLVPKDPVAFRSLENLREFARGQFPGYRTYETLRENYMSSRTEIGFATKTRNRAVLTVEDWAKRHEQLLKRGHDNNMTLWE
jgi:transcriptional regulator with XRE-family HTH domain/nucleoside 2-deoxyribosyltransferase